MKRLNSPDEALAEIQTLLTTAMRNIDAYVATQTGENPLLHSTNCFMADAHLLTTWVRDTLKEMQ